MPRKISLPRGWNRRTKSSIFHILAQPLLGPRPGRPLRRLREILPLPRSWWAMCGSSAACDLSEGCCTAARAIRPLLKSNACNELRHPLAQIG